MAAVTLRIDAPANDSNVVGGVVHLKGTQLSSGHPPLFYKWYSSELAPPDTAPYDASIPVPPGFTPLDFQFNLPPGSPQMLTLSAKDVVGDSATDAANVKNAGMAGGLAIAGNPAPCVVHVFIANIVAPGSGANVSKASATLVAQAPWNWTDAGYQAVNELQHRWKFSPQGTPAGRQSAEFVPAVNQLSFKYDKPVGKLTFDGALPAVLSTGNYSLTLRVEKKNNPAVGHEITISVVLVP